MARLQARLNTARMAATRLGDYRPTLHVFVNSVAVAQAGSTFGRAKKASVTIDERTGDVPTVARFALMDPPTVPPIGAHVYVALGSPDYLLFGGQIIKRPLQWATTSSQAPSLQVEAEGNHRLMSRRLVFGRYQSRTADYIIKDLLATYTSGFTSVHVQGGMASIDEIEFTNERVPKAIQRVCERVGAKWYLDPRNDVHAFTGEEVGVSPAASLDPSGPMKFWNLVPETDVSQVRTHITVKGAGCTLNDQTLAGTTILLTDDNARMVGANTVVAGRYYYEVRSVTGSAPFAIYIGDTPPLIGLQEVLYGQTPIHLVAVATSLTLANSIAAIEGGDGIHMHYLADERLGPDGAMNRARAELALFGAPEQRGTYSTRDPSASAGRQIEIDASLTRENDVTARITKSTLSAFEESTRPWDATRTHFFPKRDVAYSTQQLKDLYEVLAEFERGGR
jgi:hypothetical protein